MMMNVFINHNVVRRVVTCHLVSEHLSWTVQSYVKYHQIKDEPSFISEILGKG